MKNIINSLLNKKHNNLVESITYKTLYTYTKVSFLIEPKIKDHLFVNINFPGDKSLNVILISNAGKV